MPWAVLFRVAMLTNATNAVSSTIAGGPSRSSRPAYSSSETVCVLAMRSVMMSSSSDCVSRLCLFGMKTPRTPRT